MGKRHAAQCQKTVVMADGARLDGPVSFQGCLVEGAVRMDSTLMGQGLSIQKSALRHASGNALDLSYAQIEQQLSIKETTVGGRIVLTHAFAARWEWNPSKDLLGRTDLLGFTYDALVKATAAVRLDHWLSWIKRNARSSPQPYRQLERAFRADGHEQDARAIYIEGRRALRTQLATRRARLWDWVLNQLLDYGYKSGRALWVLVVIFAIGWGVSTCGYREHVIGPIRASAYARVVGDDHYLQFIRAFIRYFTLSTTPYPIFLKAKAFTGAPGKRLPSLQPRSGCWRGGW